MEKYFEKFPLTFYANNRVIDITKRVKLLDRVSSNPFAFYPYDIGNGERADNFSSRYYDDSYLSWLVYLSNDIVDPYYEWYLQPNEFNQYIEKKYGSLETSNQKIKFYRNNWENQEPISPSLYNALTDENKAFWEPIYSSSSFVKEYKRKEQDWVYNTNKIVSYTVSGGSFVYEEVCDIIFDSAIVGKGQVEQYSNNTLYLKHVSGSFVSNSSVTINANSYIYGKESGANVAFTTSTIVENIIPQELEVYFTAVTNYEYEVEKNEFNRTIRVIDKDLKYLAVDNLKTLMSE